LLQHQTANNIFYWNRCNI